MKKSFLLIAAALCSAQAFSQFTAIFDYNQPKQVIHGFGASSAWHGQLSDAEINAAFGNADSTQMGLSILRVRIDPNPSSWSNEKANALKAKAKGATILASPWSPPAYMKTNNNTTGGFLKPEYYAAYATHLKNFCTVVPQVDVISLQNEPNITVGYESCSWYAWQMIDFCKNNAPAIGTPVMMPETYNFSYKFTDSILLNTAALANIDYVGGHIYGTSNRSYPLATTKGKGLWMTEHYLNPDTLGTCMEMGKEIMDCLNGNMNAYVWWYLRQPGCNIINSGGSFKLKGYTMAQFSKFIRPGYTRVNGTYQTIPRMNMLFFKGPDNDVLVVLNQNTTAKSQTFIFNNVSLDNATKYVTSATKRLTKDGSVKITNNTFTDNLDARSITTYVIKRVPSAIRENVADDIRIYPNPADDYIQLSSVEHVKSVKIYNTEGILIRSVNKPSVSTIPVSDLPSGIYIADIEQNNSSKRVRFLKK